MGPVVAVTITLRTVISAVGIRIDQTPIHIRTVKIISIITGIKVPVITVDIAPGIGRTTGIVENVQSADARQAVGIVVYKNISSLNDSAPIIIINRYVANLDHRAIIIILYIGIIVETRIITKVYIPDGRIYI